MTYKSPDNNKCSFTECVVIAAIIVAACILLIGTPGCAATTKAPRSPDRASSMMVRLDIIDDEVKGSPHQRAVTSQTKAVREEVSELQRTAWGFEGEVNTERNWRIAEQRVASELKASFWSPKQKTLGKWIGALAAVAVALYFVFRKLRRSAPI